MSDDYTKTSEWLYRDKKPVQIWFSVFVILVMAVLLLFNVLHFNPALSFGKKRKDQREEGCQPAGDQA